MRALEKAPAARFLSAAAMSSALSEGPDAASVPVRPSPAASASRTPSPVPPPPEPRLGDNQRPPGLSNGRKALIGAAVVAAVVVVVALLSGTGGGKKTEMVLIPAGELVMGCNERVDSECDEDEKPYHEVYLDEYRIDRHEVTVKNYRKCVDFGGCAEPGVFSDCNWRSSGRDEYPVNCVSWHQANDYCQWAGKRLPTEAEWEKAARGTDGRRYPWGNGPASCSLAVFDSGSIAGCGKESTWPVCTKEAGNSPYGLCDMAGNVSEWVADWYGSDFYSSSARWNPGGPSSGEAKVLRGGSWNSGERGLRPSNRRESAPASTMRYNNVGFRCAVSPE